MPPIEGAALCFYHTGINRLLLYQNLDSGYYVNACRKTFYAVDSRLHGAFHRHAVNANYRYGCVGRCPDVDYPVVTPYFH